MRDLLATTQFFVASLVILLSSYANATYSNSSSGSGIVTQEYDTFFLKYDADSVTAFGTPIVSGNNVSFLPSDMSIMDNPVDWTSRKTWITSFAIIPKPGYSLNGFTLTENGKYSHTVYESCCSEEYAEGEEGNPSPIADDFYAKAKIYVRDIDDPSDSEFFQFKYGFQESGDVVLETWENSESYSTEFTDGFWLKLKNTLWLVDNQTYQYGVYTESFIQKEFAGFEFDITRTIETPLPASGWLLLTALGGLISFRRKKI